MRRLPQADLTRPRSRSGDHRIPTLEDVLKATRGGVILNLDTKYAEDLGQVAEMVRAMDMADRVLIKLVAGPDADNHAILGAPWFGEVPFMPIMPFCPGRLAQDAARSPFRLASSARRFRRGDKVSAKTPEPLDLRRP